MPHQQYIQGLRRSLDREGEQPATGTHNLTDISAKMALNLETASISEIHISNVLVSRMSFDIASLPFATLNAIAGSQY